MKKILWGLKDFLTKKPSFVPRNLQSHWSRAWKRSIGLTVLYRDKQSIRRTFSDNMEIHIPQPRNWIKWILIKKVDVSGTLRRGNFLWVDSRTRLLPVSSMFQAQRWCSRAVKRDAKNGEKRAWPSSPDRRILFSLRSYYLRACLRLHPASDNRVFAFWVVASGR